jgi:DNA replication licensing factor MCM5
MSGFDAERVHFRGSNRELVVSVQTETGETSGPDEKSIEQGKLRNRFYRFVREFRVGTEYTYREQLRLHSASGQYKLVIDLEDLTAFDPYLAEQVRERPDVVLPLCELAAKLAARDYRTRDERGELGDTEFDEFRDNELLNMDSSSSSSSTLIDAAFERSEIQVVLATCPDSHSIRTLASEHIGKLVSVPGMVISASRTRPKATHLGVVCIGCGQKLTIPTRPGFGTATLPRKCEVGERAAMSVNAATASDGVGVGGGAASEREKGCGRDPFRVLSDSSRYIDHQSLKLQESPELIPTGEMPRQVMLACDRYLVDCAAPGTRVSVIGVYTLCGQGGGGGGRRGGGGDVRKPYIRVVGLSIDEQSGGRAISSFPADEQERFAAMSRRPRLYEELTESVAPAIYGHVEIKRAIVAQLFGGSRKFLPDGMRLRGDINVLLLGDPGTAKSQLLKFVEKAAPVGVYTSGKGSSAAGLTASVVRDSSTREFYLEGGAMVLADGGVVCIDEFDKMDANDRVAIHEAMEQQTISIAKAGITTILNSRTAVLAAANPVFGRYDDMKHPFENIEFQSTILSRFDLIFLVKDKQNARRDRTIARHVLDIHANSSVAERDGHIGINTLKRYIAFCRAKSSPRLSARAASVLQNHYVSIRASIRAQQEESSVNSASGGGDATATGTSAIPITVRQLEAIVRISEALAKMTLSPVATEEHVNEAIRLFKVSTLEAATSGIVAADNLSPDLLRQVNQVETLLKRRIPIGSRISEQRVIRDFCKQGLNDHAIRTAIRILVQRDELEYRNQRKTIARRR